MSAAPRRAEFFALEASEYLADLEPVAVAHDRPDAERLVRGARALRGAALMAGLGTFARAAAGLESIARQVRDHALAWEPGAREAWIEGLAALRALVSRAATWEAVDDRQALALAERFEQVMTGRPARSNVPPPTALTPGVRAFIARESALIAGSLEQASRALNPIPPADALAGVLERMQSLRGLGAAAELSPLPELLDAMEVATRSLLTDSVAPPNVAAVFADAAHALATIARAVADGASIVPPPELESIARRLLAAYAVESDVVPVVSLAPNGVDSIERQGVPPSTLPDGDPVPVELVSVGDHLLMVADALARPASPAARDLRLFVLHRTLAAMPSRSATGRFLAPLAEAISAGIGNRVATDRPDAFVAMLRGCGRFLVEAAGMNDRIALIRRRDAIATSLVMVSLGAPAGGFEPRPAQLAPGAGGSPQVVPVVANPLPLQPPSAPDLPSVPDDIVEIAALAPDPADAIVDIATLAPDASASVFDVVDIASLAPDAPDEIVSIASLAPDDSSDVVSIASLAPDPVPVIPVDAPGEPSRLERAFVARRARQIAADNDAPSLSGFIGAEIVPVTSLLYRGPAAFSRADEVGREIRAMLADPALSLDRLRPYIDELLDLVPLTREAA
jgi:hypothetical protein